MEDLLRAAEGGLFLSSNAPIEAEYLALWRQHARPQADLASMAIAGGLCADRLAWVFIAGYQAAIRCTFPDAALSGWAAFAVSEDRQPDNPLPGVTMQEESKGQVLSGHKTWVAAADQIDHLIVKAGRRSQARYFLLRRDEPGLELSVRPPGNFLSELSQGSAHLNGVKVTKRQLLDDARVGLFGLREALFIYAAFCAFVLANSPDPTQRERCREMLRRVPALLGSGSSSAADLSALKQFDAGVQQLLADVDIDSFPHNARWAQDKGLISMYSKGIQARRSG